MKISEAEKLICPFMSTLTSRGRVCCITHKCMAWEMTKTRAIQDKYFKCTCNTAFDIFKYDFTCPSCGMEYSVIDLETDLTREDCEGYCKRLNIKE